MKKKGNKSKKKRRGTKRDETKRNGNDGDATVCIYVKSNRPTNSIDK